MCVIVVKAPRRGMSFLAADEGAISTKVYHGVNLAVLVSGVFKPVASLACITVGKSNRSPLLSGSSDSPKLVL